jgi:hypothetical protein
VERRKRHGEESDEEVKDKEETEPDTEVAEKKRATWQTRPMPEFRPRQPQGTRQIQEWSIELIRQLAISQPQSQPSQSSQQRERARGRKMTREAEAGEKKNQIRNTKSSEEKKRPDKLFRAFSPSPFREK